MNEIINNTSQLGPVALFMVFLNIVGLGIKQSNIPTKYNVWILPVLGAVIYPFLSEYTAPTVAPDGTWMSPYFRPALVHVFQGWVIGWGCIGANQAWKLFGGGTPPSETPKPDATEPPKPTPG